MQLTEDERRAIKRALRRPLGRYSYERAAQLSGIPGRTLHHWAQTGIYAPDFDDERPKQWSYRDLVLLRLVARLRSAHQSPESAGRRASEVRRMLEKREYDADEPLRIGQHSVILPGQSVDIEGHVQALPAVIDFLAAFDLTEQVDGLGHLSGPSLVRPSEYTSMSADVQSGEPCIRETRIPTAAVWAMHTEQGLDDDQIALLYGGLSVGAIADAIAFEDRIRQQAEAA